VLLAYGYAHGKTDPATAYEGLRRGLAVAQDNGNRQLESVLAQTLSSLAATHASPVDALDYVALAIRTYFDSGSLSFVTGSMGMLAVLLDRCGRYEAAAKVSALAAAPIAQATFPEITTAIAHLREVLGAKRYDSLAQAGANMTNAAMASYALEQIELARATLQSESQ
jgi:hypothetical protein